MGNPLLKMKISATYLERFTYCILPISLIFGIPLWILGLNAIVIIKSIVVFLLLISLFDTVGIFILYKNPKTLILKSNQIQYGEDTIQFNDIESIEIILGRCFRWYFRLIRIRLRTSKTIYAIPKPLTILDLINGKSAKTEKFIWSIPQLKDKLIISKRVRKKISKEYKV